MCCMRCWQERKDAWQIFKRRGSVVKIAKIYNVRRPVINDARNIEIDIEIWINDIINISSSDAGKKMKRLLILKRLWH